ncbi:MAG: mannosyltransferase family protein [Candidatus Daviesbacteria bacterium]|nr:mannosyltransferase family protein [Candidatus Daviesbacteria bacterium]
MKLYPNVTVYFVIFIVAVLNIFYFGHQILPHNEGGQEDFINALRNWDGGHFLGIAENGYKYSFQHAFFPLYPLLIKFLFPIFPNHHALGGVVISILATLIGLNLLYQMVLTQYDKNLAQKVILSILFFPMSFYFLVVYSEGLFFMFSVACFYFVRKNNLFLATLAAALASATRLAGLAVVAGLLIPLLLNKGINRNNWFVLLAPSGLLIYSFYLYLNVGDPFYFVTVEQHWQRSITIPARAFFITLNNMLYPGYLLSRYGQFWDLLFTALGLGLIIMNFKKLPKDFAIFSLISIGLPLASPTIEAIPRYLLPIFPIFILIALIKNPYLSFAYQIFGVTLLAFYATLFINGYWVS